MAKTVLKRTLAVIIILLGVGCCFFGTIGIVIGTLFLIGGVVMWNGATDKSFNESTDTVRRISDAKGVTAEDLYKALGKLDSPLGKPWLGEIRLIKGNCLIWGPDEEGGIINAYRKGNAIFVTYAELGEPMLKTPVPEGHKVKISHGLATQTMLEDVFQTVQAYVERREVRPIQTNAAKGKLYRFDEQFKLTGQKFDMVDMDGNPVYHIEATEPLRSFYITDSKTGEEVFRTVRKLTTVFVKYKFYWNEEEYGTFEKKLDLSHDLFQMETEDGLLEMRKITESVEGNYIVRMDGRVIGTLQRRYEDLIQDIFYDNYTIHVREPKYTPLMAALGVMAAREESRDESGD